MNERDARLQQFFSGYFNQDWDIDGSNSWTDVIVEYVKEIPREKVQLTRSDLRSWLEDPESGRNLPAFFGCDYNPEPDGMDDRTWVGKIVEFIERELDSEGQRGR